MKAAEIKWEKTGTGYKSSCGRFEIIRFIRRNGIEWGLLDFVVPIPHEVSGPVRTLRQAKDIADWRLANTKLQAEANQMRPAGTKVTPNAMSLG